MNAATRYFPWVLTAMIVLLVGAALWPRLPRQPYDLAGFARLPVVYEGRVKPMEAVARNTLLVLRNRQALRVDNQKMPAIAWLLDVMARPEQSQEYPVFRVDEPGLRNLLAPKDSEQNVFSFNEIVKHGKTLNQQMSHAVSIEPARRDPYQRKLLELNSKLSRFTGLAQLDEIFLLPPAQTGQEWMTFEEARRNNQAGQPEHPAFHLLGRLLAAYHHQQPAQFNDALQEYQQWLAARHPQLVGPARLEAGFAQSEMFYYGLMVYALAFLLVCLSWLGWSQPLLRSGISLAAFAFLLHTAGMILRMMIHGRPPVTNLYASALFVGWGCVLLALIIEWLYRNGVGVLLAGLTGFLSLLVAHNLAEGDTLEAMRAVLDNNFWLATHVVVITIGYSSMFLAGFLAILYIFRRLFRHPDAPDPTSASMGKMVYGVLCFSLLFSFVGTVLGGIWADQSWGRFWGWDPKENGALLIVLWCALILHARWGGLIKTPGVMILTVFGNVVTAWSWFGVNLMGVGLHSYGFMEQGLLWLGVFVASQLVIMALGLVPLIRQSHARST